MVANGYVPDAELTRVATGPSWLDGGKGMRLFEVTAEAFQNMNRAAIAAGVPGGIWPAFPAGCYRSIQTQRQMKDPKTAPNFGLNASSVVSIAAPGYSTHGDGRAVDIGSFPSARNLSQWGDPGRKRRAWLLEHADEYGFIRQFGEDDPNHFRHDGKTVGPGALAGGDSKEIIMALTAKEIERIWNEVKFQRKSDGKEFTPEQFVEDIHEHTSSLTEPWKTDHPDPANKGQITLSLKARISHIFDRTYLLPGLVASVAALGKALDALSAKVDRVGNPQVTVKLDAAELDASIGRVLTARGITAENIADKVADRLYSGPSQATGS